MARGGGEAQTIHCSNTSQNEGANHHTQLVVQKPPSLSARVAQQLLHSVGLFYTGRRIEQQQEKINNRGRK
jgi:hypothetical protein